MRFRKREGSRRGSNGKGYSEKFGGREIDRERERDREREKE